MDLTEEQKADITQSELELERGEFVEYDEKIQIVDIKINFSSNILRQQTKPK